MNQAFQAYTQKSYQDALDLYKKAQAISHNNTANYRIVEIQTRLEQYEEARTLLDKLLHRDSRNVLLQELDAYWYFSTGQVEETKTLYTKLIEHSPNMVHVYANMGIIFQQEGNEEKAVRYFQQAMERGVVDTNIISRYLNIIVKTDIEKSGEASRKSTYNQVLNTLVNNFVKGYTSGDVRFADVKETADLIRKHAYIDQSFTLYKNLIKEPSENISDKKISHIYYILAYMILTREYETTDAEPFQIGITYLQEALARKYGNRDPDEISELETLLSNTPTRVLQSRLLALFAQYDVKIEEIPTTLPTESSSSLDDTTPQKDESEESVSKKKGRAYLMKRKHNNDKQCLETVDCPDYYSKSS